MTVFRTRSYGLLAALFFLIGPALGADDIDDQGGTFSTPGAYPSRSNQMPGAFSGGQSQGGGGAAQFQGGSITRTPTFPNGNSSDLRQGQQQGQTFDLRRIRRAPPKPSEFQKFVEAATGRMLPVFGSAFFADAADSFNPVDNVPVSADY
ncbi:MAG: hypothetical protein ABI809_10670, partial [Caldimonas sp.]